MPGYRASQDYDIQAAIPDPAQLGKIWIDSSGAIALKVCTSISPVTYATFATGGHSHTHAETTGQTASQHHTAFVQADHDALPSPHHARQHTATSAPDHTFPGGTSTFLRADGTFATPSGSGAVVESHIGLLALFTEAAF